jgi:toxin ParE1/3/4
MVQTLSTSYGHIILMTNYRYAIPAIGDVDNLIRYTIEKWSKSQAEAYFDGLESQVRLLAEMPTLGKLRKNKLRAFPYKSHIIYYLEDREGITVVRILHSSMDPDFHLG